MVDDLTELRIERLAYGPDAIAHAADGKAVFVAGAVPGDTVRARITEIGGRFDRAVTEEVLEASPSRVTPPKEALLDNAPWAIISREAQLQAKRACVVDTLARIGHMDPDAAEALVAPCENPGDAWGYRNKVELAVGKQDGRTVVGVRTADGSLMRIKDDPMLDKCAKGAVGALSGALSYLAGSHDLSLERVGVRASRRTNEIEVALWGAPGAFPRAHVAKVVKSALKTTSLVRVMQKGPAKARRIAGVERLSGKGSWGELIQGQQMRVSAPSFFQVNTKGADRLVELVLEGLAPAPGDEAMDLYCGAGTFTLPLARACGFVSAVESYGPAVRDLRRNLELAGLDNVDAVGGDAGLEFPNTDADIIVVDPPRQGLAAEVVEQLSKQPARAIAYVSCDPATLARDLARFAQAGTFAPARVTPVDLFPQTFHVETVCLLTHKG